VGARLHQNIMVSGSEETVPPEADDYFLNKIITEIGKCRTKKCFPFAGGEGAKVHGKTGWVAIAGWPPLDPPLVKPSFLNHVQLLWRH